ncbi:MAG: helix-turn-helix transcriptional regulator [Firmicutes bacterium]|nr:helix-turn-helix transcriptional regulator [Bacillota bacterium]
MYLQRIKDLREDRDLTQTDIAKILHITQQQYSLYESGKREMPLEYIITLSNIYNVSLDYIVGRTNIKNYKEQNKKTKM